MSLRWRISGVNGADEQVISLFYFSLLFSCNAQRHECANGRKAFRLELAITQYFQARLFDQFQCVAIQMTAIANHFLKGGETMLPFGDF